MKKAEFLKNLETALRKHNVVSVTDILSDYEEHFTHGLQKGKTEEQISESLGNPDTIAKAYETDSIIAEVKNPYKKFQFGLALKALGRFIVLAPFNFFVLVIPGVVAISLIVAGWAVSLAFGAVSAALMVLIPVFGIFAISSWAGLAGVTSGLAFIGITVLSVILMFDITKYFLLGALSYLQWNLKFILEK